jgi:hypothetical protein
MSTSTDNGSIDYDKVSRVYDTSRTAHAETTEKLIRLLQISGDSIVLDMVVVPGFMPRLYGKLRRMLSG